MVATRRGVRVCSPIKTKTDSDESPDVQATPSTGRSTRSRAAQLDTAASEDESRKQPQESAEESVPGPQNRRALRRCTRSARLHSPQQSCTPTGSVHEADVSDMESSCSALSDSEPPAGGKARRPRTSQEEEAGSEAESCSSLVPEKRCTRRSVRARKTPTKPQQLCASPSDQDQEARPQRATWSTRRNARSRAPGEGGELSDADSCASGAPETPACALPTTGRSTRSGRRAPLGRPVPLHLDAASEGSLSPARGRRTRAAREAPGTTSLSCDSEGLESGPSTPLRRSTRSRGCSSTAAPAPGTDSDSDLLEVILAPGRPPVLSIVLDRVLRQGKEPGEGPVVPMEGTEARPTGDQSPLDDSKLDHTAEEEADCTVVEDKTITLDDDDDEEEEGATRADPGPLGAAAEGAEAISVGHEGSVAVSVSADVVPEDGESAMGAAPGQDEDVPSPAGCEVTDGQQRAPPQEGECDTQPPTQEALSSAGAESEGALPPPWSAPVETEDMEVDAADHEAWREHSSDQAALPIEVKSNQDPTVKVDPVEPASQDSDVIVHQKTRVISLLDSSEEEEEEEEDEKDEDGNLEKFDSEDCQILEEDNVERGEPERAGSSKLPDGMVPGGLFMIDTRPGQGADQLYLKEGAQDPAQEEEEEDEDFVDEEGDDDDDDEDAQMLQFTRNLKTKDLSSRIDPGLRVAELGGLYISLDGSKSKPVSNSLKKQKVLKIQDEVMKNSVMGPEFEKHSTAPPYSESKHRLKLQHKKQKEKTTGDSWFNMKAPELTPELKADLKVLKMRGSLDPKRFYKKNDRDGLPKYFQVGTVMDSPVDFYHSRVPKKERKRTMVEELMADSEFRRQNKKKYLEVMAEKTAQAAGRSKKKRFRQKKM